MWKINGTTVAPARFEPFVPVEVLDEYDGPRIFTLADPDGELNLACWSDEDEQVSRYVVVPTTAKILDALRNGDISVLDALNQTRCWLCDVSRHGAIVACQRVEFDAIPRDALPVVGTALLPRVEPRTVDLEGRIRELDKDRLSFELREIEGPIPTQRFVFDAELRDGVLRAFQDDARVRVAGQSIPVKNVARALAVSAGTTNAG